MKVVFSDVDNTLLDFQACSAWAMKKACEEAEITYSDLLFCTFHRVNNALWKKVEAGETTKEKIYSVRWNMIFAELQMPFDGVAFEKMFHRYLSLSAQKVEGAEDLCNYLSQKYILCAASNAHHSEQLNRLKQSGLLPYFHFVFTSESVGASKPNAAFFDGCFSQLKGIKPSECVLIGDSLSADVAGAAAYGMQTVWFNFNKQRNNTEISPTYCVNSLSEIINIL